MVACSIYRVNTAYFTLNSMIEADLSITAISSVLSTVPITGLDGESYAAHVYRGVWSELVARLDLCTAVLEQKVAHQMYSTVSDALKEAWLSMEGKQVEVVVVYNIHGFFVCSHIYGLISVCVESTHSI